jgi:hypothetical protein
LQMSPEERDLLTGLFDRIRGAANTPRDQEAETLIQDATKAQPYAPYLLAQTVLVQDQALRAANDRLQQLEGKVKELEAKAASQPRSGGFLPGLGTLFGGSGPPPAPRPSAPPPPAGGGWNQPSPQSGWQRPPQGYAQGPAPAPAPGPWSGGGGGFLTGALGTAAGVAGGVLLADSIRGLFAGHSNSLGIGTGFEGTTAGLGGETIINNYDSPGSSLAQQDTAQDAQQDVSDDAQYAQDYKQDADQDQDDVQDASDYGSDYDPGDDGSYDT